MTSSSATVVIQVLHALVKCDWKFTMYSFQAGTSARRQHVFTVYVVNELKLLPEQSLRIWIQLLYNFLNDGIYGTFIWKLRDPFWTKAMIIILSSVQWEWNWLLIHYSGIFSFGCTFYVYGNFITTMPGCSYCGQLFLNCNQVLH